MNAPLMSVLKGTFDGSPERGGFGHEKRAFSGKRKSQIPSLCVTTKGKRS